MIITNCVLVFFTIVIFLFVMIFYRQHLFNKKTLDHQQNPIPDTERNATEEKPAEDNLETDQNQGI